MELCGSYVPEVCERLYSISDPEIIDISENCNDGEKSKFEKVNLEKVNLEKVNLEKVKFENNVFIKTTETDASVMTLFSEQFKRQGWQSDEATETP
jgi:uncharacterized protein YjbI with pentapeptide repeats